MHARYVPSIASCFTLSVALRTIRRSFTRRGKNKERARSRGAIERDASESGCHRGGELSLRGKSVGCREAGEGLSYTLHRRGPWGPITGATSSLAILPQIATLKRGTAPATPLPEPATDCTGASIACLYVSQRRFYNWSPLEPTSPFVAVPLARSFSPLAFSTPTTVRLSAACNTVIGQFRGFSSE